VGGTGVSVGLGTAEAGTDDGARVAFWTVPGWPVTEGLKLHASNPDTSTDPTPAAINGRMRPPRR
jgi:hypothetical protein